MADERVAKKVGQIKARVDKFRGDLFEKGRPAVREGFMEVDEVLGSEWADLANQVGLIRSDLRD